MALCDMLKRNEPEGTFKHRKLLDLEVRSCNLVNEWRGEAFDPESLQRAGEICDLVEAELNRSF